MSKVTLNHNQFLYYVIQYPQDYKKKEATIITNGTKYSIILEQITYHVKQSDISVILYFNMIVPENPSVVRSIEIIIGSITSTNTFIPNYNINITLEIRSDYIDDIIVNGNSCYTINTINSEKTTGDINDKFSIKLSDSIVSVGPVSTRGKAVATLETGATALLQEILEEYLILDLNHGEYDLTPKEGFEKSLKFLLDYSTRDPDEIYNEVKEQLSPIGKSTETILIIKNIAQIYANLIYIDIDIIFQTGFQQYEKYQIRRQEQEPEPEPYTLYTFVLLDNYIVRPCIHKSCIGPITEEYTDSRNVVSSGIRDKSLLQCSINPNYFIYIETTQGDPYIQFINTTYLKLKCKVYTQFYMNVRPYYPVTSDELVSGSKRETFLGLLDPFRQSSCLYFTKTPDSDTAFVTNQSPANKMFPNMAGLMAFVTHNIKNGIQWFQIDTVVWDKNPVVREYNVQVLISFIANVVAILPEQVSRITDELILYDNRNESLPNQQEIFETVFTHFSYMNTDYRILILLQKYNMVTSIDEDPHSRFRELLSWKKNKTEDKAATQRIAAKFDTITAARQSVTDDKALLQNMESFLTGFKTSLSESMDYKPLLVMGINVQIYIDRLQGTHQTPRVLLYLLGALNTFIKSDSTCTYTPDRIIITEKSITDPNITNRIPTLRQFYYLKKVVGITRVPQELQTIILGSIHDDIFEEKLFMDYSSVEESFAVYKTLDAVEAIFAGKVQGFSELDYQTLSSVTSPVNTQFAESELIYLITQCINKYNDNGFYNAIYRTIQTLITKLDSITSVSKELRKDIIEYIKNVLNSISEPSSIRHLFRIELYSRSRYCFQELITDDILTAQLSILDKISRSILTKVSDPSLKGIITSFMRRLKKEQQYLATYIRYNKKILEGYKVEYEEVIKTSTTKLSNNSVRIDYWKTMVKENLEKLIKYTFNDFDKKLFTDSFAVESIVNIHNNILQMISNYDDYTNFFTLGYSMAKAAENIRNILIECIDILILYIKNNKNMVSLTHLLYVLSSISNYVNRVIQDSSLNNDKKIEIIKSLYNMLVNLRINIELISMSLNLLEQDVSHELNNLLAQRIIVVFKNIYRIDGLYRLQVLHPSLEDPWIETNVLIPNKLQFFKDYLFVSNETTVLNDRTSLLSKDEINSILSIDTQERVQKAFEKDTQDTELFAKKYNTIMFPSFSGGMKPIKKRGKRSINKRSKSTIYKKTLRKVYSKKRAHHRKKKTRRK